MRKVCTQCKEEKSLDDFYKTKRPDRPPAYKSECKKCTTRRNHENIKKKRLPRRLGGDPRYQAYQRAYYEKNIEKFKKYRKEFRERHPDYFKEIYRKKKQMSITAHDAIQDRDLA